MRLRSYIFGGALALIAALLMTALFESDGFGLLLVLLFTPGFFAVGYWVAENSQFSSARVEESQSSYASFDDDDWLFDRSRHWRNRDDWWRYHDDIHHRSHHRMFDD